MTSSSANPIDLISQWLPIWLMNAITLFCVEQRYFISILVLRSPFLFNLIVVYSEVYEKLYKSLAKEIEYIERNGYIGHPLYWVLVLSLQYKTRKYTQLFRVLASMYTHKKK